MSGEHIQASDPGCELELNVIQCFGAPPSPRANFSTVFDQGRLVYVVGGDSDDEEHNDTWELDLTTATWRKTDSFIKSTLTGHKSVLLASGINDRLGVLTYGGWNGGSYSDSLFLHDLSDQTTWESLRFRDEGAGVHKTHKTMGDLKKKIEEELSIPDARRDFTMNLVEELNCVVMTGGWNPLEWSPQQTELDI